MKYCGYYHSLARRLTIDFISDGKNKVNFTPESIQNRVKWKRLL